MVAVISPIRETRRQQQNTPARWAAALTRALDAGIEIYTTGDGQRFASSSSSLDLIYRVTPDTCECPAGAAGDPVCQHRAALRDILGILPVLVLRVDELVPPGAPRCWRCWGKGECWIGSSVDSELVTCPVCQGTGANLDAIIHIADAR